MTQSLSNEQSISNTSLYWPDWDNLFVYNMESRGDTRNTNGLLPPSDLSRFHIPHDGSCLDINSNVPSDVAFAKGYNEAHADWLGLNVVL